MLDRVRERLRAKVKDQLAGPLRKELKKQKKSRESSPESQILQGGQFSASPPDNVRMEPRQFRIVSRLELHPPTEVTEEQLTREYLPTREDHTIDSVPRSSKPPKAAQYAHQDDILRDTGRMMVVESDLDLPDQPSHSLKLARPTGSKRLSTQSGITGGQNQALNTAGDISGDTNLRLEPRLQTNNRQQEQPHPQELENQRGDGEQNQPQRKQLRSKRGSRNAPPKTVEDASQPQLAQLRKMGNE